MRSTHLTKKKNSCGNPEGKNHQICCLFMMQINHLLNYICFFMRNHSQEILTPFRQQAPIFQEAPTSFECRHQTNLATVLLFHIIFKLTSQAYTLQVKYQNCWLQNQLLLFVFCFSTESLWSHVSILYLLLMIKSPQHSSFSYMGSLLQLLQFISHCSFHSNHSISCSSSLPSLLFSQIYSFSCFLSTPSTLGSQTSLSNFTSLCYTTVPQYVRLHQFLN